MKNLYDLIQQAEDYTQAYIRQYAVTDEVLIRAIYVSHLAYLINQSLKEG